MTVSCVFRRLPKKRPHTGFVASRTPVDPFRGLGFQAGRLWAPSVSRRTLQRVNCAHTRRASFLGGLGRPRFYESYFFLVSVLKDCFHFLRAILRPLLLLCFCRVVADGSQKSSSANCFDTGSSKPRELARVTGGEHLSVLSRSVVSSCWGRSCPQTTPRKRWEWLFLREGSVLLLYEGS